MQNGFIERFNGSCRRGVLDMHVFRTLSEVREHRALARRLQPENSTTTPAALHLPSFDFKRTGDI
jgi:hypothetical protein